MVTQNYLKRDFTVDTPNQRWVTDITYVRTYEGWSMDSQMKNELIMKAMMMAVWNRKPKNEIIIHSDQGSQYIRMSGEIF